jgi:hypothetical protein
LLRVSRYPASTVGPDGCGTVAATGNRDNKEIRSMSGPMSEQAPDITVEADGRAESESTTVLVAKVSSATVSSDESRGKSRNQLPVAGAVVSQHFFSATLGSLIRFAPCS